MRHVSSLSAPLSNVRHRGFTLIELMVTIALVAILAVLAAPALQSFVERSRVTAISNDFVLGLQRARLEAVTRNSCVSMCMTSNASEMTPTCNPAGTDWRDGWIVFMNPTCDTVDATMPLAGNVVLIRESAGSDYTLTEDGGGTPTSSVTFNGRGTPRAVVNGTFRLQKAGEADSYHFNRTFCVSQLGRVRTLGATGTC
ncbi:GspH/FimT family pseudopilin [Aquabacterium sp. A7-Y]|uniref:GspH/FimT family pseudopilin n=1 Tax=Aquabacterium sp. A7-Y TaxID=1349605 RepID=UPI00223E1983|nr:GspH/FimT family pseudopilin [Aquabacterium sp. A7-Y]MCW7539178.1 GspH/FimT family pseudopilin [Aquabacterium sp. A7-Y]